MLIFTYKIECNDPPKSTIKATNCIEISLFVNLQHTTRFMKIISAHRRKSLGGTVY